jgi:hypothetical protein
MVERNSGETLRYQVRRTAGGWSVELAEACLGIFSDPADAVDRACRSAREDAVNNHLAMVTTETVPQEFHCFMPAADLARASVASPHLRLAASNSPGDPLGRQVRQD